MEYLQNKITPSEYKELTNIYNYIIQNSYNDSNNFIKKYKNYRRKNYKNICQCEEYELCVPNKASELIKCRNFNKFIENNPIIGIMFGKNLNISFSPHFDSSQDIIPIHQNFMNLFNLAHSLSNKEKIIIGISIIHYSVKNIYSLIQDKSLAKTINIIIDKFLDNVIFQIFLKEFGINYNMFYQIIKLTIYE